MIDEQNNAEHRMPRPGVGPMCDPSMTVSETLDAAIER
jgi:hypothetical protein